MFLHQMDLNYFKTYPTIFTHKERVGNSNPLCKALKIFGSDYDTFDGTPVRDFIHVEDLINGHVLALNFLKKSKKDIYEIFNLGNGEGLSVLQLIKIFENINQVKVSIEFAEKRKGDLPI